MLHVGCAEVDISPPMGVRMTGFWHDRHSTGIHDPIFARAMVLDNGNRQICFATCDVLSIRRSTVLKVRQAVQDRTGMAPDEVAISATHSHYGPGVSQLWTKDLGPDPDYVAFFEEKLTDVICQAFESRRPARVGAGWGFEGKLSFNRRFVMREGGTRMHPPPGSTDILYQEGPVDPEVGVLCARDADGRAMGYIVNFACHVTTCGSDSDVSADFPGYLATALKEQRGESCVGLFANGCCGNLCQIDVYDPDAPRSGHDLAEKIGRRLAEHACALEGEMTFADDLALDARSTVVPMPIRHLSDELIEWAKGVQSDPDPDQYSLQDRTYAAMTLELAEEKRHAPMTDAEVQAFRLGDIGWVMLPGEIFTEFGLDIKLRSPAKRTFVTELANGIVGYVPTRRAFEGGGYEPRTANSSRLAPVAGEMMVETAHALLDSMFR